MKTATEKYNAVLEGTMAKREFIRQMRQQFPQFISQFNGFDDSVQILKNKGMIFEAKKEKDNGYKVPEVNIPLDVIERGVDAELEAAGIDSAGVVTKEEYLEAKRKALHNLKKDMNHYLNLMAGESSKVDKNDKMKETKRGAQDKDTYNDMKKANLKESYKEVDESEESHLSPIDRMYNSDAWVQAQRDAEGWDEADPKDEPHSQADSPFFKENIKSIASEIKAKYGHIQEFNSLLKTFLESNMGVIKENGIEDPIVSFNEYVDQRYKRLQEESEFIDYEDTERASREVEFGGEYDDYKFDGGEIEEAKKKKAKKDYDKDGKLESPEEEYKGSKDRAIKKASNKKVNEAVKNIIVNLLSEQVINEAATANLANFAEEYSDFEGMKQNIIALQDIVTDIESFYDKTRQKIQKIYSGLGEIRNDEGLKVGAFLAPSIETAFNRDLSPVIKQGFTKGLETPKIRTISQSDIDRVNAGGELEEEPKQTVFTPVQESKKRK